MSGVSLDLYTTVQCSYEAIAITLYTKTLSGSEEGRGDNKCGLVIIQYYKCTDIIVLC